MERCEDSVPLDSKLAPFMLFDGDEPSKPQFFYSISGKKLLAQSFDEMMKNCYWVTPHGWLFMLDRESRATFLWTPLTQQKLELPQAAEDFPGPNESKCLLSEKPTNPDCVVILLDLNDTVFWFCRPGEDQWFKHQYGHLVQHYEDFGVGNINTFTTFNGKFCMDIESFIVTVEFNPNPTFTCIPVEPSESPAGYRRFLTELVPSCGDLFKVSFCFPGLCGNKITQIVVYKMDFSKKIWVRVDRLGDRAFFIDTEFEAASLPACELGLKKNSIYFSRSDDKGLYVHNMERGTTALHNPGTDIPDSLTSCFLMPVIH